MGKRDVYEWFDTKAGSVHKKEHEKGHFWEIVLDAASHFFAKIPLKTAFFITIILLFPLLLQLECVKEWLPDNIEAKIPIQTYANVMAGVFTVIFLAFGGVWLIRRTYWTQLLHLRAHSHKCHHSLRDEYYRALSVCEDKENGDYDDYVNAKRTACVNFSIAICDYLRELWLQVIEDESLGVCIRLAVIRKPNRKVYETFGRSRNLLGRDEKSKPISINSGVFKHIYARPQGRILLIRDIKKVDDDIWKHTDSDHDENLQSVLLAPINMIEDGCINSPVTTGILYITSKHAGMVCPFTVRHVQLLASLADTLGCLYSNLISVPEKKS